MTRLPRRSVLTGLAALPLLGGPSKADQTRSFRMGVTLWPADLTLDAIQATLDFIDDHCDMAAPMVLGGVPWTEALAKAPYSDSLIEELSRRAPDGHKVLLSLGILDQGRSGLAAYYGQTDNLPLPTAFAGLPFDDSQVIAAYTEFCLTAIRMMQPDWLAIGVEVNILLANNPDAWPAFRQMHKAVYRALKAEHPDQQVIFSVEAMHFLGLAGSDAVAQRAAVLDLAQDTDLIGISLYPHMSNDVPRPLPADWLDFMGDLGRAAGKPIGVCESGFTSQDVSLGWFTTLYGTEADQADYMRLLLQAADRDRFAFVVNYCSHDFDPLVARLPVEAAELAKIWEHCGLLTATGTPKPVMAVWQQAFG